MVQLVHDNVAVESWARAQGYRTVAVSGLGLGACLMCSTIFGNDLALVYGAYVWLFLLLMVGVIFLLARRASD